MRKQKMLFIFCMFFIQAAIRNGNTGSDSYFFPSYFTIISKFENNSLHLPSHERRYLESMIIINVKDGESLDKALKRFKKKFEKTGVLRELRSRQAFEKKSVTRRHVVKHAIYKQGLNQETTV